MRPIDIVRRLCPDARAEYLSAFEAGDGQFAEAGITTLPRLAHFLAQALHETDGLTITQESGNYSAKRMMVVWPSRFPTLASAEPYAHDAEKLFNSVYGNRMGNGPASSGDGYRYRGRGILQTTGREAYAKYGKRCGVDFEGSPDLVLSAEHALKPALSEWVDGGCNKMADRDDLTGITRRINGGLTGLSSREEWYGKVKHTIALIGGDLVLTAAPKPVAAPPAPVPAPSAASHPTRAAVAVTAAVATTANWSGLDWQIIVPLAILGAALAFVVAYAMRSK